MDPVILLSFYFFNKGGFLRCGTFSCIFQKSTLPQRKNQALRGSAPAPFLRCASEPPRLKIPGSGGAAPPILAAGIRSIHADMHYILQTTLQKALQPSPSPLLRSTTAPRSFHRTVLLPPAALRHTHRREQRRPFR